MIPDPLFYGVMTVAELDDLLEMARKTAVAAGTLAYEKWSQPRQIRSKGFRDIVTDADFAAQKLITDMILECYPDHGFLTEEDDSSLPTTGEILWVIDPIDGTTNYSRQLPEFSISIAAVDTSQAVLVGVIYDPIRKELFSAVRGKGAWLNDQPIHASQIDDVENALLAFDWSREPVLRAAALARLGEIGPLVHSIRAIGTAALAQAWVAAGRLDGYLNLSLKAWDVAAGGLLVQEAGGEMSDGGGRPFQWQDTSRGILATNGRIHQNLLSQNH
jgi:myo-inositol-1(or 4)-monophosphatase